MQVRTETPADHETVAALVTAAFDGANEAGLVDLVRRSDDFDPNLSLIAEENGLVIGHVLFSKVSIEGAGTFEVYCLAPLAVHPDHQNRGVGSALTEEGLRRLDRMGEPMVILEGIPSYYPRFGFERASQHGLEPPDPLVPDEAFMIRRLTSYDARIRGRVVYPAAFIDSDCVGP